MYYHLGLNDDIVSTSSTAIIISAINNLNETTKKTNNLLTLNYQNNHNPYAMMVQSTASQKHNVRKDIFLLPYSGITDNSPICMYTQIKDKAVTSAHILPKSSKMATLNNLRICLSEVNSPKNLFWFCPGIEDAFDSMKLSFTPVMTKGLIKKYHMVIWDDSCLDKQLIPGSNQFLRDFYREDRYLDFQITRTDGTTFEHIVFKRLLANQAMWSYYYKHGIFPPNVWTHGDFSSLSEEQRTILADREYVNGSKLIIEREIDENDEEENDVEENNSPVI
jgi:hypothetical protein